MKQFKKFAAIGVAAMMAVSAMSTSAFAKQEINLENGVVMTIYEQGENADDLRLSKNVDMEKFGHTIGKYPNWSPLTLKSTGKTALSLSGGQSVLQIEFDNDNEYEYGYQGIYDITAGKYLPDVNGNILLGPFDLGSHIRFSGLTQNHSYRLLLSAASDNVYASGMVWSY